ncbi:MAG: YraN family protein [Alphaproteobacteria bacterium]|nr:YraN family protein [Alphaproteobacteria bacterium]HPF45389.1 YraN family protein [Emcibacteraceae bacterium]HRW29150.1 YraN family protein [Emcibacteraceae bacterium]
MAKQSKKKAYKLGHYAEFFATLILRLKGYSIVARRYKTKVGEIDIIARKGALTIFCEVKARDDYSKAAYSLSQKQINRINRAAEYYMAHLKSGPDHNNFENNLYRCDMILIIPWRWPVHIKNAW